MSYFSKYSSKYWGGYSGGYTDSYSGSVSQWEKSYFGGYEKVLYDHPSVKVPLEIETVLPVNPKMYVPYSTRQKLIDIFLLKVSSYKELKSYFVSAEKLEKVTINETDYLKVSKNVVKTCLNDIVERETELGTLFSHYESFIRDTEYLFEIPKKEDKKGGGGKSSETGSEGKTPSSETMKGEEESDGDSESEMTPQQMAKVLKQFLDTLGKIEVGKSFYSLEEKSITDDKLKKSTTFVQMKKKGIPCKYSTDEIKLSNRLLNLLDVNFDPNEDRLNNLKMGKLDVTKIAEIPSGNTQVYYRVEENQSTKPFSVCILADESGSMSGKKIQVQNKLLKILYKTFSQILPSDKIFIFGHSGDDRTHSKPEIRIYNDKYFNGFEYTIEKQLDNSLNENYDGPVIEKVYERVRQQTSDNIIFISISDGGPSGVNYGGQSAVDGMKKIIEKCKRDGFVTVGIGISCGLVREIYGYHVVVDEYQQKDNMMITNISTLINRVVKTEFQS